MNHTIIPFSKKKMLKLTGLYILIMLGIAAIIVFILSADRIKTIMAAIPSIIRIYKPVSLSIFFLLNGIIV